MVLCIIPLYKSPINIFLFIQHYIILINLNVTPENLQVCKYYNIGGTPHEVGFWEILYQETNHCWLFYPWEQANNKGQAPILVFLFKFILSYSWWYKTVGKTLTPGNHQPLVHHLNHSYPLLIYLFLAYFIPCPILLLYEIMPDKLQIWWLGLIYQWIPNQQTDTIISHNQGDHNL